MSIIQNEIHFSIHSYEDDDGPYHLDPENYIGSIELNDMNYYFYYY